MMSSRTQETKRGRIHPEARLGRVCLESKELDRLDGAVLLGAGGYHHHIGYNVWGGPFEPLPDEQELERTVARVQLRDVAVTREADAYAFSDPSGIRVLLASE
jgi:catechol 2,3-dioxygenase